MVTLDMVESTHGKTEGLWDTDLTLPPPNAGLALLPPTCCVTLRNSLLPSGLTVMQAQTDHTWVAKCLLVLCLQFL